MQPASISKRAGALTIDIVGFAIVVWLFGHLMHALGFSAELTLTLALYALPPVVAMTCWLIGNTPGKRWLAIYIVDEKTGEVPTHWQYLRRALLFSLLISLNILFVIPVLVSRKHKAFHDMIAGTIVVEA